MKLKLILKLPNEIKIYTNPLNWVLDYGNVNNRCYFSTLDDLCDELLEVVLKKKVTNNKLRTDITSLREIVRDTREEVRNDIQLIKRMMRNSDRH